MGGSGVPPGLRVREVVGLGRRRRRRRMGIGRWRRFMVVICNGYVGGSCLWILCVGSDDEEGWGLFGRIRRNG